MRQQPTIGGRADKRPWTCPRAGCPAPTHDQTNGYRYGCRSWLAVLDEARRRAAVRDGTWEPRLVSRVGVVRRLQALSAVGWPSYEIARRLGRGTRTVERWRRLENPATTTRVRDEVRALYDELWDVPGPCQASRGLARRHGWAVPVAWDDDAIDDPSATSAVVKEAPDDLDDRAVAEATAGHLHLLRLPAREQNAVVRELHGRVDAEEARYRLGCTHEEYALVVERVLAQDRRARARAGRAAATESSEVA